ncbi:MAG: hypothetical protein U0228_29255 [Myxococcaceae bacterium]
MAAKKKTEKPAKAEKPAAKAEKPAKAAAKPAAKADKPEKAAKPAKAEKAPKAEKPAKKGKAAPAPEPEVEADEVEEEEVEPAPAPVAAPRASPKKPAPVVEAPPPAVAAEPAPEAPAVVAAQPAIPPKPMMPAIRPVMPAPRPIFVQPKFVPPPPFPPLEKAPSWVTRQVPPEQMPSRERVETAFDLKDAVRAADGSIIGLERKKLSEARLVRIIDGQPEPVSAPGQFSSFGLSADGQTVFAVNADGKVLSFAVNADARTGVLCFDGGGHLWDLKVLSANRVVVSQARVVHLVAIPEEGAWRKLDSLDVAPVDIPVIDLVDGGRWVIVGRSPRSRLVAVIGDRLREVQSWAQTEGGVTAVSGRAFLYASGSVVREEILNLAEVHQTLA